jgi:uncharacterized protein YgiM (DUF1202 family)
MTTLTTNRKLFNVVMWFIAACMIAVILTSCSPYAVTGDTVSPVQTPAATVAQLLLRSNNLTPTPLPSCVVTAYTLYMRAGAGMSHAVIDVLHNGDVLEVIRSGEWLKVITPQRVTGWVYSRYCQ